MTKPKEIVHLTIDTTNLNAQKIKIISKNCQNNQSYLVTNHNSYLSVKYSIEISQELSLNYKINQKYYQLIQKFKQP